MRKLPIFAICSGNSLVKLSRDRKVPKSPEYLVLEYWEDYNLPLHKAVLSFKGSKRDAWNLIYRLPAKGVQNRYREELRAVTTKRLLEELLPTPEIRNYLAKELSESTEFAKLTKEPKTHREKQSYLLNYILFVEKKPVSAIDYKKLRAMGRADESELKIAEQTIQMLGKWLPNETNVVTIEVT